MFSPFTKKSAAVIYSSSRRAAAATATRLNSTRLYSSTMHDNDPEVLEKEKLRNLAHNPHDKTFSPHEYAPGWNESLASASEAAVKADKSTGSPLDLQSKTVEHLTSQRVEIDGEESTTAHYVRDTVTGPLSGAAGKEEVNKSKMATGNEAADGTLKEELRQKAVMTESEEDVKADRDDI